MKIIKTKFKGLLLIEQIKNNDMRGYFKELGRNDFFNNNLHKTINFCQNNIVYSKKMVLRGLHFQKKPYSQAKYISVIKGEILDVVVDIRKKSKTYSKYFSVKLSEANNLSIFIPDGFAHGYLTLSDEAYVSYSVDKYYNPESESGISYKDKFIDIDWGFDDKNFIISAKDKKLNSFDW
tara:strand:- start:9674 stop:10210 length:537 start_codon:yes stop_codon:yes gene_type:complete